ncbi:MAG: hypothetical protein NT031_03970 [Planctomycetota bacterium]|nr:hypothetical protein [Planctomycetota bacterium]
MRNELGWYRPGIAEPRISVRASPMSGRKTSVQSVRTGYVPATLAICPGRVTPAPMNPAD